MLTFTLPEEDVTAIKAAIAVASAHFGWTDRTVTEDDVETFVRHTLADALESDLQGIYEASGPFCEPGHQQVFCPRSPGRGYFHAHEGAPSPRTGTTAH